MWYIYLWYISNEKEQQMGICYNSINRLILYILFQSKDYFRKYYLR